MRVLVAMSGGVDSSVAAGLLLERGLETAGATFLLTEPETLSADEAASRSDAVRDARSVCAALGIPHYTLDFRALFAERVRRPFIESYLAGKTPNPCVECNRYIKFPAFLKAAEALGYERIATGHYACLERDGGMFRVKKAHDIGKDQSYVLYTLTEKLLERLELPLGGYTKAEIRSAAVRLGLTVASKPDSQDICFIPDGDTRGYIGAELERLGLSGAGAGYFVSPDSKVLGAHSGIWSYTLGQHKRLGISLGSTRYVCDINATDGSVTLTEDERLLFSDTALLRGVTLLHPTEYPGGFRAAVKARYGKREASASVAPQSSEGVYRIEFDEPQRALTPGQSAVFYNGDELIGGGVIVSDSRTNAGAL